MGDLQKETARALNEDVTIVSGYDEREKVA